MQRRRASRRLAGGEAVPNLPHPAVQDAVRSPGAALSVPAGVTDEVSP